MGASYLPGLLARCLGACLLLLLLLLLLLWRRGLLLHQVWHAVVPIHRL